MARGKWKKKKEEKKPEQEKKFNKIIALGIVILFIAVAYTKLNKTSNTAEVQKIKIPGEYALISNMQNTHETGKVKMIVFFDFYCPHCFTFDARIVPQLKSKYGRKLEVIPKGYPIFGQKAVLPLQAYEIAKNAGKGEEFKNAVFEAYHINKRDISSIETLADIAAQAGLNKITFKNSLEANTAMSKVSANIALGDSYNLQQTPTVVLDGQLVVTEISIENLDLIISALLE